MLSSIHPLGERAKHNRFSVTAVFHLAGSALGGLLLGLAIAGPAAVVGRWVPDSAAAGAAAGLCLAGAAVGTGVVRVRLPSWRRQVNERWLTEYRGWVYGFGFGAQLGCGVATIITTPLVHVTVGLALLSGSAAGSVLIGATFGLVRGATLLLGAGVTSSERLVRFHQEFQRRARPFNRVASSVVALAGIGLVAGAVLP